MTRSYLLIIFYYFLINLSLKAQQQYITQTHALSIADGLLSNTINVIYEDSRGIVWIGTNHGLNRYDGILLQSYTQKEGGLRGNLIHSIKEDIHGNIWIASSNQIRGNLSLNILDPINQKFQSIDEYCATSFQLPEIVRIIQNYDATIWLISKTNQIYEYDGKKLSSLVNFNSNQQQQYFICKTDSNELSITTSIKKERIDSVALYNYQTHQFVDGLQLKYYPINSHYFYSPKSSYWLAYKDSSIRIFSNALQPLQIPDNWSNWDGSKFFKATDDYFFIGDDQNVAIFNKEGILQQQIPANQENYFKNAIYIDQRNGAWYKDYEREELRYIRYSSTPFKAYDLSENKPSDVFRGGRGIIKLQDSLLFVGSILPFSKTELNQNLKLHMISSGSFGVSKNSDNEFWIGSENGRAILIDSTGKLLFQSPSSNFHEIAWIVLEDQDQKVWSGTNNGLSILDRNSNLFIKATQYNEYPLLKESAIFDIHEKEKVLYLCTSSGLYVWDKQTGAQACFLKHQSIAHLYEDKDGLFWLASKGGGLIKFDPRTKQLESFTTQNGLANNVLYAVYEDDYNNLWMSSDWGIMCFDKNTQTITSYVKENGLLENEFNTSSHYQDEEGFIYFGSQTGIIIFHPKDFQTLNDSFPLIITQASKFDSEVDLEKNILPDLLDNNHIELYPNHESFQLTAALLDYRNPRLHQYAYIIEGFNNTWRYQRNPLISINQLPYGSYSLRIKVKGIMGSWIELAQPITIYVYKPFYLQTWFIMFILALGIGFLLFIFKMRTNQLLKRQKSLENTIQIRTKKIAQQAEDLKSLDQVKSRFFANISHELRTPLTLILGPLSLLLDQIKDQNIKKEAIEKGLFSIQKNGNHLLSLVEEILNLSKMEHGKLETYEETIHLKTYAQNIFESFVKQAKYLDIKYTLETNLEDDLYVLLDENKVTKLLNNLLSNAFKFTPTKASVALIIKEQNKTLEFIVRDTGIGIHPNDLPHIFERFYQSNQPNRPAQGGTGIGLALVYEFTQLMQGNIDVESSLNKGTSFNVSLPKNIITPSNEFLEQENMPVIQFDDSDDMEMSSMIDNKQFTILLVEDHVEMRDFITQILSTKYRIIIARNGIEGLDLLNNTTETIDLIISDVMMPKMDGFEMLQQIKALPKWVLTPMIMLTARAAEKDKLQALTIGVDDYLTKPFSVEELKARIKNLLTNSVNRQLWKKEQITPIVVKNNTSDNSIPAPNTPLQKETTNPEVRAVDLEWLKDLENLILEELDNETISIADFAEKLHISERHFSRKLKQITGLSPAKMLKTVRLNLARTYLETGKFKTVKEVAFSVGFQTVNNFSKSYKKQYGKLPSEYFHKS